MALNLSITKKGKIYYKTIKLQPRISELSNLPKTSKELFGYFLPKSCVAMNEHELIFAKSMTFIPPVFHVET